MPAEADMATTDPEGGADPLDEIRAGKALTYAYDVYGTGRVRLAISWDLDAASFVEEREDCDMVGGSTSHRMNIDEETAWAHVRAAKES
jgi:hypothetical protein